MMTLPTPPLLPFHGLPSLKIKFCLSSVARTALPNLPPPFSTLPSPRSVHSSPKAHLAEFKSVPPLMDQQTLLPTPKTFLYASSLHPPFLYINLTMSFFAPRENNSANCRSDTLSLGEYCILTVMQQATANFLTILNT